MLQVTLKDGRLAFVFDGWVTYQGNRGMPVIRRYEDVKEEVELSMARSAGGAV